MCVRTSTYAPMAHSEEVLVALTGGALAASKAVAAAGSTQAMAPADAVPAGRPLPSSAAAWQSSFITASSTVQGMLAKLQPSHALHCQLRTGSIASAASTVTCAASTICGMHMYGKQRTACVSREFGLL